MPKITKIFFLLLLTSLLKQCKPEIQAPEFIEVKHINLPKIIGFQQIDFTADALFHNPNGIGLTVSKTDISLSINDVMLGKTSSVTFEVPANADFNIPLKLSIAPKALIANPELLTALNQILNKKSVNLQYNGSITVKKLGITLDIPITGNKQINL